MLPTLSALLVLLPASGFAPAVVDPVTTHAPASPVTVAQDPVPDKREDIAEKLAQLKAHAGERKGAEDREAIAVMEDLTKEFPDCGPKDRKAIVDGVSNTLKMKRKEDKEGKRDNKLFLAAAKALGQMGPDSVKAITGWIGHKAHKKDLPVQRELILALGRTKDEKSVKTLIDLLDHKDPTLQAAAAEALGNHVERDQKVRKQIFEEVMKIVTSAHNLVLQDVTDNIARERYDAIKGSMITTMQLMSKQDIREPDKFRSWWNNNKKKNWDED
jgi:hypothetical protein